MDNYDNLKSAVIDFDGSNNIQSALDNCITLTETTMYGNSIAPLRVRAMEQLATDTASTSSRFLSLPTRYISFRSMQLLFGSERYDVKLRTPESITRTSNTSRPREFCVTTQIEFDRVPDSAYTVEMNIYRKLTALDSSNPTNDILTNFPNIYFFGMLWAANIRNAEEDKASYYYNQFISEIKGANALDKRGRHSPNARAKVQSGTP